MTIKLPEPFGSIHDSHLDVDMAVAPVPVRPSSWYMKPEHFTNLYTEAQLKQAIKDALEEAEQICFKHRTCLDGTSRDSAMGNCEIDIRRLKDQL